MRYLRDERPQQRIGHSGSESQTGRQEDEGHIVTQSKEGHSSSGGDQGYHGDDLILKLTNSRQNRDLNWKIGLDLTPFQQRKNENETKGSNEVPEPEEIIKDLRTVDV